MEELNLGVFKNNKKKQTQKTQAPHKTKHFPVNEETVSLCKTQE